MVLSPYSPVLTGLELMFMCLTRSNSGLFSTPGFLVSPSDLSMSSIFGLWSSYMLGYCWLFALLLGSARYFPGAEGKWIPLPPMSPPSSPELPSMYSFDLYVLIYINAQCYLCIFANFIIIEVNTLTKPSNMCL